MFPSEFAYVRAESIDQALELLSANDGSKLLAGGHSLIPMLKMRLASPTMLIDIGRISDLKGITVDDDQVRIGALTTHTELSRSETLREHCPLLAEAAAKVADPQVRNRGTIGGNIAHAYPAADLPAPLLVLEATVHLVGAGGARQVPIAEFFVGLLTTALNDGEVISHLTIPVDSTSTGSCYLKMEHPASGYAVCGAAAMVASGTDSAVRLALNGVTPTAQRNLGVESALAGSDLSDSTIDRAVDAHLKIEEALSDAFASGEFRTHLAGVWSKRALKLARDGA